MNDFSELYNALDKRTRLIASVVGREARIRDLERTKRKLAWHHKAHLAEINELIDNLEAFNRNVRKELEVQE